MTLEMKVEFIKENMLALTYIEVIKSSDFGIWN